MKKSTRFTIQAACRVTAKGHFGAWIWILSAVDLALLVIAFMIGMPPVSPKPTKKAMRAAERYRKAVATGEIEIK
jgi:hypothetical protein